MIDGESGEVKMVDSDGDVEQERGRGQPVMGQNRL